MWMSLIQSVESLRAKPEVFQKRRNLSLDRTIESCPGFHPAGLPCGFLTQDCGSSSFLNPQSAGLPYRLWMRLPRSRVSQFSQVTLSLLTCALLLLFFWSTPIDAEGESSGSCVLKKHPGFSSASSTNQLSSPGQDS